MRKGTKHTKESLNKMSLKLKGRVKTNSGTFRKGLIPWNKGKKGVYSKETLERISQSQKGIKRGPLSEATKLKLSLVKTGKPKPEGYGAKMSLIKKGIRAPHREGANCNWWKGGYSSVIQLTRKCFKYRQWRSDVFERDNFTCHTCSIRGGKLEAHHVKAFSLIFKENEIKNLEEALICEELWNINNGQTLCQDCHFKTDNYGNRPKK